ncbi:MAG: hypothetical protein CM15mP75_0220 [Flammeovirgaceae bacterium]|nr:MAG: hypothetical protein CM15mP75_0220 [Flammeovirgaceae bacterium]
MVGLGFWAASLWAKFRTALAFWPGFLFASFMLSAGFAAFRWSKPFGALRYQGVMIGLLGRGATFAPLVADTRIGSHGDAIAGGIVIGGTTSRARFGRSLKDMIDPADWRFAPMTLAVIAISVYRCPSLFSQGAKIEQTEPFGFGNDSGRPLGFAPNTLQCPICFPGVGCCFAMSVPQVHIIP